MGEKAHSPMLPFPSTSAPAAFSRATCTQSQGRIIRGMRRGALHAASLAVPHQQSPALPQQTQALPCHQALATRPALCQGKEWQSLPSSVHATESGMWGRPEWRSRGPCLLRVLPGQVVGQGHRPRRGGQPHHVKVVLHQHRHAEQLPWQGAVAGLQRLRPPPTGALSAANQLSTYDLPLGKWPHVQVCHTASLTDGHGVILTMAD